MEGKMESFEQFDHSQGNPETPTGIIEDDIL